MTSSPELRIKVIDMSIELDRVVQESRGFERPLGKGEVEQR